MNDIEKKLAADIKVYDTKGNLIRKEERNNFPQVKKRKYMKKAKKGEGGWK